MNSFGQIFRIHIFGESHGPAVGISIDGCPAGLDLTVADFSSDMERRKGGTQKGTTPRGEEDIPVFLSGIFNDRTTGSPLTIIFENKNTRSSDYSSQRDMPRPGHADMTASQKFKGFEDFRGGGHFSGRLTAALVTAGVVAKKITQHYSDAIIFNAKLISVSGNENIDEAIDAAIEMGDSVGGIVECRVNGLQPGLGEPFFNSVESLISHAVFAIPAIKGIEFGSGFAAAKMWGSEHNDAIADASGKTLTNHSGGISGGLTNSNELVFRVVVKPPSSTPKEQVTFNKASGEMETLAVKGRHDLCIALRVPVVVEAVTAIVIADLLLMSRAIS